MTEEIFKEQLNNTKGKQNMETKINIESDTQVSTANKRLHFTKANLKARGWTERTISIFYPEPDEERLNGFSRNGKTKLYLSEKVTAIEETATFKEFRAKNNNRVKSAKEGAQKAAITRCQSLLDYVWNLKIEIPYLEKEQLLTYTIEYYNNHKRDKGEFDFLTLNSDPYFLNRIARNYIFYELTDYSETLNYVKKQGGKGFLYDRLSRNIDEEIKNVYPWLNNY
ncbi:hypothetical protein [Leptospira ilyithenensis]|uniref:Uncharacterized protein n=1 Tax=Leptospira ilyithenensis TaxID=2484901 RepID=A0A4R9LUJ0_9LEPT|nr:hypothetical protein [Leptospira ilyithenensis]TGN14047.1 hypothetical protein EHS11_02990 [Leptospira ilyithenensis]